ncbi:MAG: hypothetical protein ACREPB_05190 [Arenimonas sp.]
MSDIFLGEGQPLARTTPTWETELLISGATVFGLMQLPDPLNRMLIIWMNGNEGAIVDLLRTISIYLQFSLITLILTFVLHLVARGYWVALVGLHSVYPQGIRWDKNTSGGPAYREIGKANMGSMPELIEKADNRATQIFSLGFGMAMAMMVASAIVGIMVIILMVVQALHGDLELWNRALWTTLAIFLTPFLFTYVLDYQFGEKLKQEGKDGWIKKIFSWYQMLGMGNASNPIVSVYTTNAGIKKTTLAMFVVMVPFMLVIGLLTATRGISIDNGAYDGLPKNAIGALQVVRPEYYASSRGETYGTTLMPFIESEIASSDYLKLFIPYQPSKYNALLIEKCPAALGSKAVKNGEGLNCLAKLLEIQLDDQLVTVPLLGGTDMVTGQRGMIAMIDIRTLADGQHKLKIKSLQVGDKSRKKDQGRFHIIPFWK